MYKKGDLKKTSKPCGHFLKKGYCYGECEDSNHSVTDARDDNYDGITDVVYLPHSCDEWVIGKRENIEWLMEDLKGFLDE